MPASTVTLVATGSFIRSVHDPKSRCRRCSSDGRSGDLCMVFLVSDLQSFLHFLYAVRLMSSDDTNPHVLCLSHCHVENISARGTFLTQCLGVSKSCMIQCTPAACTNALSPLLFQRRQLGLACWAKSMIMGCCSPFDGAGLMYYHQPTTFRPKHHFPTNLASWVQNEKRSVRRSHPLNKKIKKSLVSWSTAR
jgi:hypothetical protein